MYKAHSGFDAFHIVLCPVSQPCKLGAGLPSASEVTAAGRGLAMFLSEAVQLVKDRDHIWKSVGPGSPA